MKQNDLDCRDTAPLSLQVQPHPDYLSSHWLRAYM